MRRHAVLLALVLSAPATAQSLDDRLREQLRSTVTQLREAQSALATAEAGKVAAEKERDALKAKGSADPQALAAARSQASAADARARASDAGLSQANAQIADLKAQIARAQGDVRQAQAGATLQSGRQARLQYALDTCATDNDNLVLTGKEVVAAYIARFGDGRFPPFQLARTRFETVAQGYGDRIAAARYAKPADIDAAPLPANRVNAPAQPQTETNPK